MQRAAKEVQDKTQKAFKYASVREKHGRDEVVSWQRFAFVHWDSSLLFYVRLADMCIHIGDNVSYILTQLWLSIIINFYSARKNAE